MAPRYISSRSSQIIASFVSFLLLLVRFSSFPTSASASATRLREGSSNGTEVPFRSGVELRTLRRFKVQLAKARNASVKTIQSPDGDVIDCVPTHLQPAFEHPKLRGQKPEDAPAERPRTTTVHGDADAAVVAEDEEQGLPQAWRRSGESCPEGTIPVRRTTEHDLLRASSLRRFGMKARGGGGFARRDSTGGGHEVASPAEFSLSQIWVISGAFGNDLNTIEAGWQVSPQLYGDNSPRFFTYWTNDAYQETGCYNLHCSGFVQTSNRIAIGAAISPISAYNGRQFDINILIWKDPKQGHWWLQLGSGALVGYWPSSLFTHLGERADMVQFGGEVVNARPPGAPHTPTQMGSGRFPGEGYARAAYFRNAQVVDWDNSLVPAAGLRLLADRPGCYGIASGSGGAWGTYFYYGGPGRNARCP
ncbi:protein neprosin-like isoform X2 [Phragmites australis]|uniref:protein neprosin-like isoform X2 n=1 Tax=Phragmites australis TaxID=29695 RepID=UPI002D770FEA|nr:protein neprosin-like isoform X2 [Phragmites australis]